jgi:hypothetical protein
MTTRVLPPISRTLQIKVHGRTYTGALGSFLDVPDQDAYVMTANGWTNIGLVGTTAQRPAQPGRGQPYYDTTLAYTVFYDGALWRNPANGTAV